MSPEEKELLEQTLAVAQENNKMLHSMRRSQRFSSIMTIVYWLFILGVSASAYYYIQPYLVKLLDIYSGAGDAINNIQKFGS